MTEGRKSPADRDVAQARRIVERQRKIVAAHKRRNINASDAEALLRIAEGNLAKFEADLARITQKRPH